MRLIPILMIAAGVILIVAARKDQDPRNVIFEALGFEQRVPDPLGIGEFEGEIRKHTKGASVTTPGQKVTSV